MPLPGIVSIVLGLVYLIIFILVICAILRIFAIHGELKEHSKILKKQNELLNDLVEGLRPETQLRIMNLIGFAFDLSVEQVCRLIKRIREENHIENKEVTLEKIHKALTVMYEDRCRKFDTFTFRGVRLSKYCNNEWIDQVAKVVENEIYNVDGPNNKRAFTNVKLAYDNIKTDFYQRLNNK